MKKMFNSVLATVLLTSAVSTVSYASSTHLLTNPDFSGTAIEYSEGSATTVATIITAGQANNNEALHVSVSNVEDNLTFSYTSPLAVTDQQKVRFQSNFIPDAAAIAPEVTKITVRMQLEFNNSAGTGQVLSKDVIYHVSQGDWSTASILNETLDFTDNGTLISASLTFQITDMAGSSYSFELDDVQMTLEGDNQSGGATIPAPYLPARQIAVGYKFSCAINIHDEVKCWGNNDYGILDVPSGMGKVYQIFGGGIRNDHICAIAENGPFCWGRDANSLTTIPTELTNITQFAVGYRHTCALTASGVMSCWSSNGSGQSSIPFDLQPPTYIDAGVTSTCVITQFGSRCWGAGTMGQTSIPSNILNVKNIAVGYHHSCLVDDSGVRCFGSNTKGQLNVPSGLVNVKQVTVGRHYSCALDENGIICWGDNKYGALNVPSNLSNVTEISSAEYHSCALDETGVHCWGDNGNGRTDVPAGL